MTAPDATVVHLVDASPYIFRAYHSLPSSIKDPTGQPANAVYGFAGFLLRLVEMESPTHLAVCFDGSLTSSFRNEMYPAYKAQRELPPAELEAQLGDCRSLAEALGMRTYIHSRFEADDLLGSLTRIVVESECAAVLVTSDKDLAQLVSESVVWFDFARDTRYGPMAVEEKFGVRPDQIADYLGLAGDSVDNIPGVRGVGPKTAVALLDQFGHLEEIIQQLDRVQSLPLRGAASIAGKIEAEAEMAVLSKRLATVETGVPIDVAVGELRYRGVEREPFERICRRLGFEGLRARVLSE